MMLNFKKFSDGSRFKVVLMAFVPKLVLWLKLLMETGLNVNTVGSTYEV